MPPPSLQKFASRLPPGYTLEAMRLRVRNVRLSMGIGVARGKLDDHKEKVDAAIAATVGVIMTDSGKVVQVSPSAATCDLAVLPVSPALHAAHGLTRCWRTQALHAEGVSAATKVSVDYRLVPAHKAASVRVKAKPMSNMDKEVISSAVETLGGWRSR